MKKILIAITAITFILALFLAGCAGQKASNAPQIPSSDVSAEVISSQPAQESAEVEIKDFTFTPETVTIQKGGSVTWINLDSVQHTVSIDGMADSDKLGLNQEFTQVFDKAGEYPYICTIHASMTGKVIVK